MMIDQKQSTMKKLLAGAAGLLVLAVISQQAARHPRVAAQSVGTVALHVSFAEVVPGAACSKALNAHRPDMSAIDLVFSEFGAPQVVETADASGIAPECEFGSGAGLTLLLNRQATALAFNRYGTVEITLRRSGEDIRYDNSSGLGGRYQRLEPGGFDEIVLVESSFNAPLRLDELQLSFPQPAVTVRIAFDGLADSTICSDGFRHTPNLAVTTASATGFAAPLIADSADSGGVAPECEFYPGNSMTITLDRPATGLSYDLSGAVDYSLFLKNAQLGPVQQVWGLPLHFHRTRPGGFDQINLLEASGFSSFKLDNLEITFPVAGTVLSFDFAGPVQTCASAIAGAHGPILSAEAAGEAVIHASQVAGGALAECGLEPDTNLTISFVAPASALSFKFVGMVQVSLLRNGVGVQEVHQRAAQPGLFTVIDDRGFDRVIIENDSSTVMYLDDLSFVFPSE